MTDSPLDEILETLTNKLPIKATEIGWEKIAEDIQEAKQAIELYCHKQVIEELERFDIDDSAYRKRRIAELRKTL
jgi:hypothetical protein